MFRNVENHRAPPPAGDSCRQVVRLALSFALAVEEEFDIDRDCESRRGAGKTPVININITSRRRGEGNKLPIIASPPPPCSTMTRPPPPAAAPAMLLVHLLYFQALQEC